MWRAAIAAAIVNVVLSPGVSWIGRGGREFVPVWILMPCVAVAGLVLPLLISELGAHRLRRELRTGHRPPRGGTAEEKRLLAKLPATPWQFGVVLGVVVAALACLVVAVMAAFGFHGFAYGTFVTFMAFYTGGVAFLVMRWVIVRELMEAAHVG